MIEIVIIGGSILGAALGALAPKPLAQGLVCVGFDYVDSKAVTWLKALGIEMERWTPPGTFEQLIKLRDKAEEIQQDIARAVGKSKVKETEKLLEELCDEANELCMRNAVLQQELAAAASVYDVQRAKELSRETKAVKTRLLEVKRESAALGFEIPIDGLEEPVKRSQPKAGRNDPCPCGSGKKYKKCCLKKEESE